MPPRSLLKELVSLILIRSAPCTDLNLILTGSGQVVSAGGPLNLFLDISPSAVVGKIEINLLSGARAAVEAPAKVPPAFPSEGGSIKTCRADQRLWCFPSRCARTEPSRAWPGGPGRAPARSCRLSSCCRSVLPPPHVRVSRAASSAALGGN